MTSDLILFIHLFVRTFFGIEWVFTGNLCIFVKSAWCLLKVTRAVCTSNWAVLLALRVLTRDPNVMFLM